MVEFTDVQPKDWFYSIVTKAARMGGIKGYEGKFRPNDNLSRAEAAAVYVRAVKAFRYALPRVRKSIVMVQNSAGGEGTGVIVDPRGLVWTNRHVVTHTVGTNDSAISDMYRLATCEKDYFTNPSDQWLVNRRVSADVDPMQPYIPGAFGKIHRDETGRMAVSIDWNKGGTGPANCGCLPDFALIQMSPEQLAEAKQRLGDPLPCATFLLGSPDIAEPMFQYGNPLALHGWFSHLYAARRYMMGGLLPVLGLDGGVNPGNSGGPVWTLEGLCVGMTTWKLINLNGVPVDSMGLAQVAWELGVKWLAYHKVAVKLAEDIPDEDELVA